MNATLRHRAPAGRFRRRLTSAAASMALLGGLALGALMLLPPLAGYERYVITGDSMSGTIDRGAIVYAKTVPVRDLRTGDVITYTPPAGAGPEGVVTHRIVWRGRGASGKPLFRTKGDANRAADPWRFELADRGQARVEAQVPYAGYAVAALGIRWVRMLLIGLPAVLVAVGVLAGAWREAGAEAGSAPIGASDAKGSASSRNGGAEGKAAPA